jgi:hypothetical protein
MVFVDGVGRSVDCTEVDHTIHAIQWSEEKHKGVIEFVDEDPYDNLREPNIEIDSFAPYQWLLDAWEAAAPPPPEERPDDPYHPLDPRRRAPPALGKQ